MNSVEVSAHVLLSLIDAATRVKPVAKPVVKAPAKITPVEAGRIVDGAVKRLQAEHPDLNYGQALHELARTKPLLIKGYQHITGGHK